MLLSWLVASIILSLLGPLCWRFCGYTMPRWEQELEKRKEHNNDV